MCVCIKVPHKDIYTKYRPHILVCVYVLRFPIEPISGRPGSSPLLCPLPKVGCTICYYNMNRYLCL